MKAGVAAGAETAALTVMLLFDVSRTLVAVRVAATGADSCRTEQEGHLASHRAANRVHDVPAGTPCAGFHKPPLREALAISVAHSFR